MAKIAKRIVIFTLAALAIAAKAAILAYAAPQIETGHYEIEILENGNAEIKETWVVLFDDEQTYTRYWRSYLRNHYSITNWSASIDGKEMKRLPEIDDARPDYSFAVETKGSEHIIHLYSNSYDIKRIFTISYTVVNAVRIFDDVADFVWDLTGENEASAIGELTAEVIVPKGAAPDEFLIWAHGPERGVFSKEGENRASLHIGRVYSYQIVDIRISLPPHLFSGGYYAGGEGLNEILEREKALADEANARREAVERYWQEIEEWEKDHPVMNWFRYSDLASGIFAILIAAEIFLVFFFPAKTKKMLDKKSMPRYVPEQTPEYCKAPPDETPPAVLSNLFAQFKFPLFKAKAAPRGNAFSATMLDMFAKGYLKMRKNAEGEIEIAANAESAPSLEYERTLVSLISEAAGSADYVSLDKIRGYINANQSEVYEKKNQFEREVKAEAKKSPYIEEYKRDKSSLGWAYLVLLGLTALFGTFFSLYIASQSRETFSIMGYCIAFIFGGMAALLCLAISKKGTAISQLGTTRSALWAAFGKFLDDFADIGEKEFPEFGVWEQYLVYGTSLGKSKNLIQELMRQYPVENMDEEFVHREMFEDLFISGAIFETIENIQSKAYAASPPSSDSGGGGGGFSSSGGSSGSGSSGSGFD